jgi:hypothetical protein
MAEDKSEMSMMEYSGDFGAASGGCQDEWVRRVDSRVERRVLRGVRWVEMSKGEGSRVRRSIPAFMSWVFLGC